MPVPTGQFRRVREVIEAAKAQGCEERHPEQTINTPWGEWRIRYLYNPKTRKTYDISDLADDESMSPSMLRAMERRLEIKLIE